MDNIDAEHLELLPTETRNPRSGKLDELTTMNMLRVINAEDATVAETVGDCLPQIARAVDAVSARFEKGGRLFYVGAGTSGRLGVLDASECPPTFSVPQGLFVGLIAGGDAALRRSYESSEDSPEAGVADLAEYKLTAADSLVGIAASGRTPYVLGAMAAAKEAGALTIGLTCAGGAAEKSKIAAAADIAIELATGPEVLTGSTRMKAGTATKLALNMLSTGVMVRQGAVYGNLMVNVQPSNEKLVNRARRIIVSATACSLDEAARLLDEAGSVKVAIAMSKLGLRKDEAEARLKAAKGSLRVALCKV
jgi:N-acetylmuramic acid 6-phosphate etherase